MTIILTCPPPSIALDSFAFNFNNGTYQLTAPSTGSTAGIAIWSDRNLPYSTDVIGTGSGASVIKGAIYAPSRWVKYAGGTTGVSTGCTQIIAYDIMITGNSTFANNCVGVGTLDVAIKSGAHRVTMKAPIKSNDDPIVKLNRGG